MGCSASKDKKESRVCAAAHDSVFIMMHSGKKLSDRTLDLDRTRSSYAERALAMESHAEGRGNAVDSRDGVEHGCV